MEIFTKLILAIVNDLQEILVEHLYHFCRIFFIHLHFINLINEFGFDCGVLLLLFDVLWDVVISIGQSFIIKQIAQNWFFIHKV